jgi:Pentapeptide repeats (9 copies)
LAQANEEHRQTIVDLICGYLRIRKEPPAADGSTGTDANQQPVREHEESEVRATAQKILLTHLRIPYDRVRFVGYLDHYWDDISLDLHGAQLENFSLEECLVEDVDFREAEFFGWASFSSARFAGRADFAGATFRGPADFYAVKFGGADFSSALFHEGVNFDRAGFFRGGLDLSNSKIRKNAYFVVPKGWNINADASDEFLVLLLPIRGQPDAEAGGDARPQG